MDADPSEIRTESKAWILIGLTGSTVGRLVLEEGRLTFAARGIGALSGGHCRKLGTQCGVADLARRLVEEEEVLIFDEPVTTLRFTFPWYTFGGGMNVRTGDGRFRISFLRPANTALEVDVTGGAISEGRGLGRRWKALLTKAEQVAAGRRPRSG